MLCILQFHFFFVNNIHINNISNYFQITNQLFQMISNGGNAILIPKQILYKMYNTMTHFKELLHIVPSIW